MKKITLDGIEYNCPTGWHEITLEMQMQVSADSDAITIPELKKFAILSGYCGIPQAKLKHAKLSEITKLFKNMAFVSEDIPQKPITEFDFNGKHYYCGQNLVDMQFQDFISIENVITENSGSTYNALPTILAIMCKQKKTNGILETIDDYDVQERSKEFMDLPITIAHSLSLFFSTSEALYSNLFQSYLKPETQKELMAIQVQSVEDMLKELDGRGWLTRCVTGILRYLLKYTQRQLDKHYTSIQ